MDAYIVELLNNNDPITTLDYHHITEIFDLTSKQNINEKEINLIKRVVISGFGCQHYLLPVALKKIVNILSKEEILSLTRNFLNNISYLDNRIFYNIYELNDHDEFIALFKSSKIKNWHSIFIGLKRYTQEQEILALRDLTSASKIMPSVYKNKYVMSYDAILQLPPVMRLKTLESLTAQDFIGHNIFENIDKDDFKGLLFGSALKYVDRANHVWERFCELSSIKKDITPIFTWQFECEICGGFSIKTDNKMMTSKRLVNKTKLKYLVDMYACPICGCRLESRPQLMIQNEEFLYKPE